MQAILAVFRGEATLASAPEQEFATTTTIARDTSTTSSTSTTSTTPAGSDASSSADATPTTTLPVVSVEENNVGVAPDRSVSCD